MSSDDTRNQLPADPLVRATALELGSKSADNEALVLAQAQGQQAERLIQLAREHEIPVLQDLALSSALGRLPPGSRIPEAVFLALGCTLDFLLQQDAERAAAAADKQQPAAPET
jgi:flagellar biosynthesis protein